MNPEKKKKSRGEEDRRYESRSRRSKSRSQMSKEIKKGNVYLNHKQIKDPIKQVEVGDLLSVRGYGRAQN